MVIKDLLSKVDASKDADNPEVQALRDKLSKLKQSKAQAPAPKQEKTPQKPKAAPEPDEDHIQKLAKASAEEQRRFGQEQDPSLKIKEERTHKLVAVQVGEIIELTTELNKRLSKLEQEKQSQERKIDTIQKRNEELKEKMDIIDQRLEKFMGLYEVITNRFNPFSGVEKGEASTPPPSGKLQVSDDLTGQAEEVPIEQGEMSSENAKKIEQLIAELERDEREKREATEDEVADIEVREEEREKELVSQMHSLLEGFEGRLKNYMDDSVQSRLHDTFTRLESVLNEEIEQAVQDQVSKLKESEDVVSAALKEIEELSGQASDKDSFEREERSVASEVQRLDDQIRSIPPSLFFRLHDGSVLKGKSDLIEALEGMDQPTFSHHVTDQHNDFADWLELALEDPLGQQLRGKSREEMISVLRSG